MAEVRCRVCGEAHDGELRFCPRVAEPTAVWDGPCGTQVDRYYVERLIGGGGMGAVYLARHVHLEQPVALKLLKATLAASRDMVERFVREAKAAAAIGNPHIIRVSDFGITSDGRAFLAMELLEGQDLDQLLAKEKTLAPARAARIALQVLDGLAAAHAAGIVHRDLKPANIFLLPGDQVKLVDFGVSKMRAAPGTTPMTQTGLVMGTPMYMAPEQFKGPRELDQRVDVYAVGVTLYQMLSGVLPYDAPTYESLILQIYTEPPRSLAQGAPSVPAPLARVIERAMARDPAQRYGSAPDLADALRAAMATIGDAVPAAPPPRQESGAVTPFETTAPQMKPPVSVPVKKPGGKLKWIVLALFLAGGATAAVMVATRRTGRAPATAASPPPAPPPPPPAPPPPRPAVVVEPDAEPEAEEDDEIDREIADVEKEFDRQIEEALKPPPPPKPRPPPTKIEVEEPEVVGNLSGAPIRQTARDVLAKLEECRRDQPETVLVQFHVAQGKLRLHGPAPRNTGDAAAARCVASRIREAAPRWKDEESGIIFLEVRLPAKK